MRINCRFQSTGEASPASNPLIYKRSADLDVAAPRGWLRYLAALPDPRRNRTKRHLVGDILTIAIGAVICGADGWVQAAQFGRCKLQWFQTFPALPHGIPSYDTFGRVLARLDPTALERGFLK